MGDLLPNVTLRAFCGHRLGKDVSGTKPTWCAACSSSWASSILESGRPIHLPSDPQSAWSSDSMSLLDGYAIRAPEKRLLPHDGSLPPYPRTKVLRTMYQLAICVSWFSFTHRTSTRYLPATINPLTLGASHSTHPRSTKYELQYCGKSNNTPSPKSPLLWVEKYHPKLLGLLGCQHSFTCWQVGVNSGTFRSDIVTSVFSFIDQAFPLPKNPIVATPKR